MENITYIDNDGSYRSAKAYQLLGQRDFAVNQERIRALFTNSRVNVSITPGGVKVTWPKGQKIIFTGEFFFRGEDGELESVPEFSIIDPLKALKDAWGATSSAAAVNRFKGLESNLRGLYDHSVGAVRNIREDINQYFHVTSDFGGAMLLQGPSKEDEELMRHEDLADVFKVGKCWEEKDTRALFSFFSQTNSGGITPVVNVTHRYTGSLDNCSLKSLYIYAYGFDEGVNVFPNDVIVRYNNKYTIIRNVVREDKHVD
jgi:hypothetical protein